MISLPAFIAILAMTAVSFWLSGFAVANLRHRRKPVLQIYSGSTRRAKQDRCQCTHMKSFHYDAERACYMTHCLCQRFVQEIDPPEKDNDGTPQQAP
jgi:hypothetical protein